MYYADYMEDHIGEEYDAMVTGMQGFGLFVQLPNRVEGLLKFENMKDDMDLNAGTIVDGEETLEEVGARILDELIEIAGGKRTKSELFGMGNDEFMVWGRGLTS